MFVFCFRIHRRRLFNEHHYDPSYQPLPEERPGGFNWDEPAGGAAAGAAAADPAAPRNA